MRKPTIWTALATLIVSATVAAGLPENDAETAPDGVLSAAEGESASTGETAAPLPVQEPDDCSVFEDWCKMRWWVFCQKWHLSSTPDFPPEEDEDDWEPQDILGATGDPHGLERGWTLDDHHTECRW